MERLLFRKLNILMKEEHEGIIRPCYIVARDEDVFTQLKLGVYEHYRLQRTLGDACIDFVRMQLVSVLELVVLRNDIYFLYCRHLKSQTAYMSIMTWQPLVHTNHSNDI